MAVYTLHSQGSYGLGDSGLPDPFTLGTQFSVSQSVSLTGIWFYSGSTSTSLPTACALYNANTGAQIAGTLNSSPSWSGAAGSGWVKCTYSGPTLTSGTNYVVAVYNNPSGAAWLDWVSAYWTSGAGASGITNGPLSAPGSASAVNGQAVYNTNNTGIAFPSTTNAGYDFGVDVEVTTIAAGLSVVTGGQVARRRPARAAWRSAAGPANAHGGSGTVQPRGVVPVPRRYPARALWRGPAAVTTVNAAPPAGQRPRGFISSRRPVGGLWGGLYTPQANASGPSGTVQPRAAVPVPRRTAARATWRGPATVTAANAAPVSPAGMVQPRCTVPVPRRTAARATWRGPATVTAANAAPVSPAGMVQPRCTVPVPRRTAARGWRESGAGPANAHGPSGTVQPPAALVARRGPARAVQHGTILPAVNATAPAPPGAVQPPATAPHRPHAPQRVLWHSTLVSTVNASGPAVPAPKQRPAVTSRTTARAVCRHTTVTTANSPAGAVTFTYGIPYFDWYYGTPHF